MKCGIYVIENKVSGTIYVGSAVDFNRRWSAHRHQLRRGSHASNHLQSAWNKYGPDAFTFRRLIICGRENLIYFEQRAIDAMHPGYNVCRVAGSTLGRKYSEETLAKLRAVKPSAETRARMSESQKGRKHSDETKAKLSAAFKGIKLSPERRAILSRSLKGHSVSAETRAKLAAAARGKSASEEVRAKISAASTGRRHTPEARAKISAAKIGNPSRSGIPQSPETRAKIRAKLLAYWQGRG